MSSDSPLDRRAFVRRALTASAATVAGRVVPYAWTPSILASGQLGLPEPRRTSDVLRIGLVAISADTPVLAAAVSACRDGVELGIEEATRAATLLRKHLDVAPTVGDRESARSLIASGDVAAVMVAGTAGDIAELGAQSVPPGTVLINCLAPDDTLRNEQCVRMAFHIAASEAMTRDAQRSDTSRAPPPNGASTTELWHGSLERYGAGQLNDRFRARFKRPMNSAAWAGWLAVKVLWEASQRARSVDGRAIAAFLERDSTAFDGHKGVPLSFRGWDHQLRQPLYFVPQREGSEPEVTTVPLGPSPSRDALDALGTSSQATRCQWR